MNISRLNYKQSAKRLILALLVVVSLLCVIPMGIYAEDEDDSYNTTEVQLLEALGIIELDPQNGYLWDDSPVKRRELAEIVCKMFGIEDIKLGARMFDDVKELDRKYVEAAVKNGYMSGYGDGFFGPGDYVTGEQLMKILVCALNGGEIAKSLGGYPEGYVKFGEDLGLTKGIRVPMKSNMSRIDVVKMIYTALRKDMINFKRMSATGPVYESIKGETFLTEKMNVYRIEGIVNKLQMTSIDEPIGAGAGLAVIGNTTVEDPGYLADEFLGAMVVGYIKMADDEDDRGELIFIESEYDNAVITVDADAIIKTEDKMVNVEIDNRRKNMKISPIADMVYNGKAISFDMEKFNIDKGFVRFVDNNDDNVYDLVVINKWSTGIVESVNTKEQVINFKMGEPAIALEDNLVRIIKNDAEVSLEELKQGDVLLYTITEGNNRLFIRIDATEKNMNGTIGGIWEDGKDTYIEISGEEYEISPYIMEMIDKGKMAKPSLGKSGQFYLDSEGDIAYYTVSKNRDGVAFLMKTNIYEDNDGLGVQVKIFNNDGTFDTIDLADKVSVDGKQYKPGTLIENEEITTKLLTPQLISFSQKDGKVNKINFAREGYDLNEFSKDASGTILCNPTGVLSEKFAVGANTVVFCVPDTAEYMDEEACYAIDKGGHFIYGRSYNVDIYEVNEDSTFDYAVVHWNIDQGRIDDASQLLLVTNVSTVSDENDDIRTRITAFNESGNKVEYLSYDTTVIDKTVGRLPKPGEVIQCGFNYENYIISVKIQQKIDDKYYLPKLIYNGQGNVTTKVYGRVAYANPEIVQVYCDELNGILNPTTVNKIVFNKLGAAYRVYENGLEIEQIDFTDIQYNDKIFACVNTSNKTRMIVIYK